MKSRIALAIAGVCCLCFLAARGFEHSTFIIESGDDGTANEVGIVVNDKAFGTIHFPAALTGSAVSIEGKCAADDDWAQILDSAGNPLAMDFAASSIQRIPDEAFGVNRIRFVSDDTEGADRTFFYHVEE